MICRFCNEPAQDGDLFINGCHPQCAAKVRKHEQAIEKLLADVQSLSWGYDPVQQAESISKNKEEKGCAKC